MKIAVNTRLLLKNKLEGIGWFTYETLKRITVAHPEHQFYFIFDRPYSEEFIFSANITPIVSGPQSRHPILWYLFFQISVKKLLRKLKPDIYVSPESYMPLGLHIPSLIVMHDIAYEHYPETVPSLVRKYYKYFFPRFAKQATRIATVSEFSKQDIVKYYSVPESKIHVVYNGFNTAFHPVSDEEKLAIRQKFSGGNPYFVFLGGLYPRKNIARLIQAFELFKKKNNSPHKLILIGKHVFGTEQLLSQANASEFKNDIIFTGRIDSFEELNALLASAEAMTYVSIFEGFGIPCLEAMKCGSAVIASNTSSLPEVCGDAALYVDPLSVVDIADAMQKISTDTVLKTKLIEASKIQLQKFSWNATADKLWNSIEKTMRT